MATREEAQKRLAALIEAGFSKEEALAMLKPEDRVALQAASAEAMVAEAKAMGAVEAEIPSFEDEENLIRVGVNKEAFEAGWGDFAPAPVGRWLSECVEVEDFDTDKGLRLRFGFKVVDERLPRNYKGTWFSGFDRDAGKIRYALDKMGVPFKLDEDGVLMFSRKACYGKQLYTDWQEQVYKGLKQPPGIVALYALDESLPETVL
jgi:hypothetical protein